MAVLLLLAKPLGLYMAWVYEGRIRFLSIVERFVYRLCGTREDADMNWKTYAIAMLLFNAVGLFAVYFLQRVQSLLPLNPQAFGAVSPDSSLNTAVSFATNTNWQGYGGETTMSYLTQMLALTVQNFVSAATGMAVLIALDSRAAQRHDSAARRSGNFWVDLTRTTLYILLPLSLVLALVLVSQGVVQTFNAYHTGATACNRSPMPTATPSPSKCCRLARPLRRSPSSSWARTAAASSTSTRRIRLRTRHRSRTFWRCCPSC